MLRSDLVNDVNRATRIGISAIGFACSEAFTEGPGGGRPCFKRVLRFKRVRHGHLCREPGSGVVSGAALPERPALVPGFAPGPRCREGFLPGPTVLADGNEPAAPKDGPVAGSGLPSWRFKGAAHHLCVPLPSPTSPAAGNRRFVRCGSSTAGRIRWARADFRRSSRRQKRWRGCPVRSAASS